jgi:hypothetical protein
MDIPIAEASQWVELTAPKAPMSSGRVVNLRRPDAPGRDEPLTIVFPC